MRAGRPFKCHLKIAWPLVKTIKRALEKGGKCPNNGGHIDVSIELLNLYRGHRLGDYGFQIWRTSKWVSWAAGSGSSGTLDVSVGTVDQQMVSWVAVRYTKGFPNTRDPSPPPPPPTKPAPPWPIYSKISIFRRAVKRRIKTSSALRPPWRKRPLF